MAANTLDLRRAAVGYEIEQLVSHSRQQWWRDKTGVVGGGATGWLLRAPRQLDPAQMTEERTKSDKPHSWPKRHR